MNENEVAETAKPDSNTNAEFQLYHEKQRLQLCLLHTLNSLFQRREFTKSDLDCIALNLDSSYWFNRHRSIWGTGNYDVNVLFASLETKGFSVVWFDARRSASVIDLDKVFGFIFNTPSNASFLRFWSGRHWFAVRRIGDSYYNFDSKFPEPVLLQNFVKFADEKLASDFQMMLVLKPEFANSWLLSE